MLKFDSTNAEIRCTNASGITSPNAVTIFLDFSIKSQDDAVTSRIVETPAFAISYYYVPDRNASNLILVNAEAGTYRRFAAIWDISNSADVKRLERTKFIVEFTDTTSTIYFSNGTVKSKTFEPLSIPEANWVKLNGGAIQELYNLKIYNRKLTESERTQLLK